MPLTGEQCWREKTLAMPELNILAMLTRNTPLLCLLQQSTQPSFYCQFILFSSPYLASNIFIFFQILPETRSFSFCQLMEVFPDQCFCTNDIVTNTSMISNPTTFWLPELLWGHPTHIIIGEKDSAWQCFLLESNAREKDSSTLNYMAIPEKKMPAMPDLHALQWLTQPLFDCQFLLFPFFHFLHLTPTYQHSNNPANTNTATNPANTNTTTNPATSAYPEGYFLPLLLPAHCMPA